MENNCIDQLEGFFVQILHPSFIIIVLKFAYHSIIGAAGGNPGHVASASMGSDLGGRGAAVGEDAELDVQDAELADLLAILGVPYSRV